MNDEEKADREVDLVARKLENGSKPGPFFELSEHHTNNMVHMLLDLTADVC